MNTVHVPTDGGGRDHAHPDRNVSSYCMLKVIRLKNFVLIYNYVSLLSGAKPQYGWVDAWMHGPTDRKMLKWLSKGPLRALRLLNGP